MSEKKLSIKYLNQKMEKQILIVIKTLEERINTVNEKVNIVRKRVHRKKRAKIHTTRQKKYELNIKDLKNILEVPIDSKNELKTKLDNENKNLINLKEQIRDFTKHSQTNPFNFYNTIKDDEIDSSNFIEIAENNIIFYESEPIFNIITDAGKDNYPFVHSY